MALLRYTLLRVGLLLAVAALLWLIGLRGVALWLFAILVSGIVSIFVLNRSRDAVSETLADRVSTVRDRLAADDAAEEADDEAARRGPAARSEQPPPTDTGDDRRTG